MIHVPGGSAEFFIYKTRILYGQSFDMLIK